MIKTVASLYVSNCISFILSNITFYCTYANTNEHKYNDVNSHCFYRVAQLSCRASQTFI